MAKGLQPHMGTGGEVKGLVGGSPLLKVKPCILPPENAFMTTPFAGKKFFFTPL